MIYAEFSTFMKSTPGVDFQIPIFAVSSNFFEAKKLGIGKQHNWIELSLSLSLRKNVRKSNQGLMCWLRNSLMLFPLSSGTIIVSSISNHDTIPQMFQFESKTRILDRVEFLDVIL